MWISIIPSILASCSSLVTLATSYNLRKMITVNANTRPHGNPMASICWGILATGTMRIDKFQARLMHNYGNSKNCMRGLIRLYTENLPWDFAKWIMLGLGPFYNLTSFMDTPTLFSPGVSNSSAIAHGVSIGSMPSVWLFGPEQSAQDVIKRHEGVLRGELV